MPPSTLIFGHTGQLARALRGVLGADALTLSREHADFLRPATVIASLEEHRPQIVFNAVAYTAVDKAETEQSTALRVNAEVPGLIARWCREHDAVLVHYSTDYVFSGTGREAWREEDVTRPCNYYGVSKREGERAISNEGGRHLIFRTSWVFDGLGKNFFTTMLRLAQERDELRVVNDQIGAPTYAPHLAKGSAQALKHALTKRFFPSGIYHLCGDGFTNWHGFARAIFDEATRLHRISRAPTLIPIPSTDYPTPAVRPLNSRLDCGKAIRILATSLPSWEQGLTDCFMDCV